MFLDVATNLVHLYFGISPSALAYLDPGTGSIIFQLLLGSVVGGIFFITSKYELLKAKLKQLLGNERKKDQHSDDE